MKQFHIGDILSVSTGCLVSDRQLDGLYDIMDYMSGSSGITTLGLYYMSESAEASLKRQLPWLSDIKVPDFEKLRDEKGQIHVEAAIWLWVRAVGELHGEWHYIDRISNLDVKPVKAPKADNYMVVVFPGA
jgi:hypothetical protein